MNSSPRARITGKLTGKLQSVVRAAARLVLQLPYHSSDKDLMHRQLHWLDILSQARFKICLLVYKCLHWMAPRYLSNYCIPVPISSTRSNLHQTDSRSVTSSSPERELRQSALMTSFMHHLQFGTRSPMTCTSLNCSLAVSETNKTLLSFFLNLNIYFSNSVIHISMYLRTLCTFIMILFLYAIFLNACQRDIISWY